MVLRIERKICKFNPSKSAKGDLDSVYKICIKTHNYLTTNTILSSETVIIGHYD